MSAEPGAALLAGLEVDRSRGARLSRYAAAQVPGGVRWLLRASGLLEAAGRGTRRRQEAGEVRAQCVRLCKEYVYCKLRRHGLLTRSLLNTSDTLRDMHRHYTARLRPVPVPSEVSTELQRLGALLERWYPHVYGERATHRNSTALLFSNENLLHDAFLAVARHTFYGSGGGARVTWGRLVSMYAILGMFAYECARQGRGGGYVDSVVDMFAEYIEQRSDITQWILEQPGGWTELILREESSRDQSVWLKKGQNSASMFLILALAAALATIVIPILIVLQ